MGRLHKTQQDGIQRHLAQPLPSGGNGGHGGSARHAEGSTCPEYCALVGLSGGSQLVGMSAQAGDENIPTSLFRRHGLSSRER